ncbi:MAG: hypothetical protein DRN14_04850 [Thermoplasmata archaeon]|nr:MAG: hypothetical protein DRN14_04850 [Thermoplasmata archaeon]
MTLTYREHTVELLGADLDGSAEELAKELAQYGELQHYILEVGSNVVYTVVEDSYDYGLTSSTVISSFTTRDKAKALVDALAEGNSSNVYRIRTTNLD